MDDLPDDWFIEHDGQRLVLDPEKVAAEIDRLRSILKRCMPGANVVDLGGGEAICLFLAKQPTPTSA